ncbi:extracellular solute-binding protein (plasmid) [Aliirhizobium terrae]|nr:extracellular solute-binding protein [Rhizobium sp. CC-CFT758]WJH38671.1 extracellular solute-binding protein [Rhizobium sp. CC-CFT758]
MTKNRLLIATVLLVGTAQAAVSQERVSWWYEQATPDQQKLIQQNIIEPYNKANPDYALSVDYRGSELDKQLRVAMLSGNGPDVVYTAGPSYVAPMAQSGQLMALDDYAAKYKWQDRILPVFLKMGEYDGKLYALPKTYETVGLFYNKTLFEKTAGRHRRRSTNSKRSPTRCWRPGSRRLRPAMPIGAVPTNGS